VNKEQDVRREEIRAVAKEVQGHSKMLLITAITVVCGLFWQQAIKDTINFFIPTSGAWMYELVVSLFITVVFGIIIYILNKEKKAVA